jgi:rhodanese-related sulfurtransferase
MKACYSCSSKPIKNGVYKSNLEEFIAKQLPKDNTHTHKIGSHSRIIKNLKPNTCIFYFASKKRDFTNPLQKFKDAYGTLKNSGVTRTDSKGNAKFFLDCPQVYISLSGKVHERHLHYLYWEQKNKMWNPNLYTQPLICDVNQEFVKKNMNKALIIDALPEKMYNKKHIKGAINIPYNKTVSHALLRKKCPKMNKNHPIIVYCYSKECEAALKLIRKLNKLGYANSVHYKAGIQGWKGPIESSN